MIAAAAIFLLVILYLFVSSFQRREVVSYTPTTEFARADGALLVQDTVTLDARDGSAWVYFDLQNGRTVEGTIDPEWDIAFQRFHVVTNGGDGYPGEAGALALTEPFAAVSEAPAGGYETTRGSLAELPANPALERWYSYGFFSHVLEPKPETYVIRTRDGRYAKLAVLSYYCPEATPGCFTFEYAYRADGERRFED